MNILRVLILMVLAGWFGLQQQSATASIGWIPDIKGLRDFIEGMSISDQSQVSDFIKDPLPELVGLVPSLRPLSDGWRNLQSVINKQITARECVDILEIMWKNKIALGYTYQSFGLLFRELSPDSIDNLERLLPRATDNDLLVLSPDQHTSLMRMIPESCPWNQIPLFYRCARAAMSLHHYEIGSQFEAYLDIVRALTD
jgi:hypothetical protein